jgi:hypothetical protein
LKGSERLARERHSTLRFLNYGWKSFKILDPGVHHYFGINLHKKFNEGDHCMVTGTVPFTQWIFFTRLTGSIRLFWYLAMVINWLSAKC